MDLFFSPDIFSPDENIDQLEKKADFLQSFRGITVSRSILKETKNIISILLHNSCVARTVNHLRLLVMQVFDFFDSDSHKEIFQYVIQNPEKNITLSPRISQAFTLLILNIHKNIPTFSELVINFLNFDPTVNFIFSYSTFPAIFGYFTLDYLCELAGEFLIEILKHQNSNAIRRSRSTGNYFWALNVSHQNFKEHKVFNFANQMVASFFISMHQFIHCLWSNFRSKIIYQPKDIKQLFQFFCDALNNAAYYLTSHHQVVLSTYIAIDRENCVSVIFHDVFAVSLKENFPELFQLYNYFIYLGDQPMSEESNQVFTILTKSRKFNPCIPKLPPPNIIQRVPIAMSECDIYLVTEIVNRDKRFASDTVEMIQSKELALKKGYIPFYADIIVPANERKNLDSNNEQNKRQTRIFFATPKPNNDILNESCKQNENEDTDFKRKYLIIQNIASLNGIDELDAIKHVIFPDRYNQHLNPFKKFQNKDMNFAKLCLKQYIQSYNETQAQINNLLFLKQWSQSVENYASLAEITKKSLLFCFANNHIDEVNNSIDPKNRMTTQNKFKKLFKTIMNVHTTPRKLIFYSCIKLLNQIIIKPDPLLTNLVSRYNNYSKGLLSDSVHHWADENPQIASHLVDEVQDLRMQFNLKIGEIIHELISLTSHLMTLCKEIKTISYQSLFDFIIEEMKPSKVAEIIVVLKVFVVQNKMVTDIIDQSEFALFENLMNSFYKLLRLDSNLLKDFLCY